MLKMQLLLLSILVLFAVAEEIGCAVDGCVTDDEVAKDLCGGDGGERGQAAA